jgi:queuosine precursor transporter
MTTQRLAPRAYRYFDLIMASFVAVLLISNVASSKILALGPFTFDGGTILFPLSYIFGDVLTEVYGYQRSRRVIWAGFVAALVMALIFALVGVLPPAAGWDGQAAYQQILGITPRIVLGSLVAYFAGEFSNSWVLAKMKILTRGRWLWTRTIGSTLVGEGVDTLLFVVIAFYGTLSLPLLLTVILSNYVFKCGFEALATPITYGVVNALKRAEQEDYYDYHTDFNPFKVSVEQNAGGRRA